MLKKKIRNNEHQSLKAVKQYSLADYFPKNKVLIFPHNTYSMNRIMLLILIFLIFNACTFKKNVSHEMCRLNRKDSISLFSFPHLVTEKGMSEFYDSSKLVLFSLQFNTPCGVYNGLHRSEQKVLLGFHELRFDTLIIKGDSIEFGFKFINKDGLYCSESLNGRYIYFSVVWNIKSKRLLALIPWTSQIIWQETTGEIIKKDELSIFVNENVTQINPWLLAKLKQLNWICK